MFIYLDVSFFIIIMAHGLFMLRGHTTVLFHFINYYRMSTDRVKRGWGLTTKRLERI